MAKFKRLGLCLQALPVKFRFARQIFLWKLIQQQLRELRHLIDGGKIDEAKTELQALLNTVVVTTEVIQLPKLRAEQMLKVAQTLAEKKDRTNDDNDKLAKNIQGAREQLELGEMLGYGTKKDYKPIYEQLDEISKKSAGGKNGIGWFEKIRKQLSDLN